MNYRITAEKLNMTQPAVTQHIQFLEKEYGARLFIYAGRTLIKTPECEALEVKARIMQKIQNETLQLLKEKKEAPLEIGATKTIGELLLAEHLCKYAAATAGNVTIVIDNTDILLRRLLDGKMDFAIIEGNFNKKSFAYKLISNEAFSGICSKDHPFAGKSIDIKDIFSQPLLLREEGSGSRTIFESSLNSIGWSINNFKRIICINNVSITCSMIEKNLGIAFAYKRLAEHGDLATFTVSGLEMTHEFNLVFLPDTDAEKKIEAFEHAAF